MGERRRRSSSPTFRAAVVAADTQPLCVALNVFVVELDPERPAQVRLPHRVLQSPPGIREPVGDLREREIVGSGKTQIETLCNCFDSKHFHIHSKTQTILYENVGPLPAIRLIQKERLEAEDRGRVRLQSGSLKLSFKKHPRRSRETSQHASCLYQHHVETFNTSKRQQTQRLIN